MSLIQNGRPRHRVNPRDVLGNTMAFGREEALRLFREYREAQRRRESVFSRMTEDNTIDLVSSSDEDSDDEEMDDIVAPIVPGSAPSRMPGANPEWVYTPSLELQHLQREGYLVIPCISMEELPSVGNEFRTTLAAMPEFKHGKAMLNFGSGQPHSSFRGKPVPFVGGGFSALGNPSSFHNMFVRNIRQRAHACVLKAVFGEMLQQDPELKFEQVIDRMMFRRAGQSASAESWHRDESKHAKQGDNIFGGWINLDTFDQKFSGVPRSHTEVGLLNRGFATIPKSRHADLKRRKQSITIPPGHIFIFYERMVHEVVGKKLRVDQHRLFLGWRTTYQTAPLTPKLEEILDRQAVVPIKSGQIPPMYPALYWTNWRDRILMPWSDEFIADSMKEERVLKKNGQKYVVVQQHVEEGLTELETQESFSAGGENGETMGPSALCPAYTPSETRIYYPSRNGY